jgi:hypothetical protein
MNGTVRSIIGIKTSDGSPPSFSHQLLPKVSASTFRPSVMQQQRRDLHRVTYIHLTTKG